MGDSKEAKTNAAPLTNQQAQVIACSQLDGYQVSCFQTARHAVFVVSDLPEGDNLALARALAPSVFAHITASKARLKKDGANENEPQVLS